MSAVDLMPRPARATFAAPPRLRLATPDGHFLEGEPVVLLAHPPDLAAYEFSLADASGRIEERRAEGNRLEWRGLQPGAYKARARCLAEADDTEPPPGPWSTWLSFEVHSADRAAGVEAQRVWQHRCALMLEEQGGVSTLTDPWAFPPSCPESEAIEWFRTPVYEGATPLINEDADYYRDPLQYFLDGLRLLQSRGTVFLTWHDVLEGRCGRNEREVLLQFDLDGGPQSFGRLLPRLLEIGVPATAMIHREAHDWYEYSIDQLDFLPLREAERNGWCIGYHNNALNNVQRWERAGDYSPPVMAEARQKFLDDVDCLRRHFDVRTYTAHGGNVLNHTLTAPDEADVTCVDRSNAVLWKPIRSMFSDGGLASRPCSLRRKLETVPAGLHFFRHHPFKYGNYRQPWDVPPLDPTEAALRNGSAGDSLLPWIARETAKQSRWLQQRDRLRLPGRLSYATAEKPLSRRLKPRTDVQDLVQKFRGRRKPFFLREYPWAWGDPRVFWWRLLHAYGPREGQVLNVGALPPESRDETSSFLAPGVEVLEMDIDARRAPHLLADITDPPAELRKQFAGVLLFGLPYIHSPGRALDACRELAADDGVGIFGFPCDTHPLRGRVWNAAGRPLWRRECEPLDNIGLKGNLWCFDRDGLADLFRAWEQTSIECFSDYWFAVCRTGRSSL